MWSGSAGTTGVDLNDLEAAGGSGGQGFVIARRGAGDHAGAALAAIADLNGDGRPRSWSARRATTPAAPTPAPPMWSGARRPTRRCNLSTTVGAGSRRLPHHRRGGGRRRRQAWPPSRDLNGDGKAEILVGAPGSDAGRRRCRRGLCRLRQGHGTAVNLGAVAGGTGGFRITGARSPARRRATRSPPLGDVNGDGVADILVGARPATTAYVVFGKADTAEVCSRPTSPAGIGGFAIRGGARRPLAGMSVAGGGDLNRDGIADLVIGAPGDAEGGANAGAVYVVWGGAQRAGRPRRWSRRARAARRSSAPPAA